MAINKRIKFRPAQAIIELALGLFSITLILTALFTFISYIVSSLNMSRDIRAKAGRAAFTSMGGEGSYSISSKSDSVTVSSMAAEHLFQGKNELKIREEVKIPNMKIPQ